MSKQTNIFHLLKLFLNIDYYKEQISVLLSIIRFILVRMLFTQCIMQKSKTEFLCMHAEISNIPAKSRLHHKSTNTCGPDRHYLRRSKR
jgi:hypothetical protein